MLHSKCMSLLRAVDEAVKLCKNEEARITENIRQCKDILRSMRTLETEMKETEEEESNIKDDVLPEERQEIELLERVLQKALRVRGGSVALKEPEPVGREGKERAHSAGGSSQEIQSATKPTARADLDGRKLQKSALPASSRDSKGKPRQHGGQARASVVRGSAQKRSAVPGKGLPVHPSVKGNPSGATAGDQGFPQASVTRTQKESHQKGQCGEDMCRPVATHLPPPKDPVLVALTAGTATRRDVSPPKGNWIPSPLLPTWRAKRAKQSRLWDKVLAEQSKPVPEKTRFTERLFSTFSKEWPSGSPADTRAEVHTLAQRCRDLTHCYHAELQANRPSTTGTEPGTYLERDYDSLLMVEGLERMMTDLLRHAGRLKRESEAWDRWRSGAFRPVRRRGRWGGPADPCLPPVLAYTCEAELRELESLGLRVEQLQHELHLQQALSEDTAPYLPTTSGRPSAAELRSLYSLLGEGGVQFPSLVLDCDPD